MHPNTMTDEDNGMADEADNLDEELERGVELEGDVDKEGQLSYSEVVDYRYELESSSDEEEDDDSDFGKEDN